MHVLLILLKHRSEVSKSTVNALYAAVSNP